MWGTTRINRWWKVVLPVWANGRAEFFRIDIPEYEPVALGERYHHNRLPHCYREHGKLMVKNFPKQYLVIDTPTLQISVAELKALRELLVPVDKFKNSFTPEFSYIVEDLFSYIQHATKLAASLWPDTIRNQAASKMYLVADYVVGASYSSQHDRPFRLNQWSAMTYITTIDQLVREHNQRGAINE